MKFAVLFLFSFSLIANEDWNPSFESGMDSAREKNLPVIIDFYTDWCGFCKVLENKIFPDPEVSKELSQFQKIRINGDQNRDLVSKFKIKGYPTVLFLDSKGGYLGRVVGLPSAKDLAHRLKGAYERRNLEEFLLKKAQDNPNSVSDLFDVGIYYYQSNNHAKAEDFFLKAFQIQESNIHQPKKRESLFLLGVMQFFQQKYSESISIWTQYLMNYPDMDVGYPLYYRGIAYYETGKKEQARKDFQNCFENTQDTELKEILEKMIEKVFPEKPTSSE
jgi:tetratricopeptide (TPR) repeat protein